MDVFFVMNASSNLPANLPLGQQIRPDNSRIPVLRDGEKHYRCLDPENPADFPYNPGLLCPVSRALNRDTLDIRIPFAGYDLWHFYELSYLDPLGLPQVFTGEFIIPQDSPYLIESKSLKLYLNSFNMTVIKSAADFQEIIRRDLSSAAGREVRVRIFPLTADPTPELVVQYPSGIILEDEIKSRSEEPAPIDCYEVNADLLKQDAGGETVTETLITHLLRSNCLVTGQPDWGTLVISYTGRRLDHETLLRYVISYRNHREFHEHCAERIFTDLENHAKLEFLDVRACYTRRGGIDINPRRCSREIAPDSIRLERQ